MVKIAPSIFAADFSDMTTAVKNLEAWGADMIHCDVLDGSFVPSMSFGAKMIEDIRKHTSLVLDAHLMVVQPERHIEDFAKAGADLITIHAESTTHVHRVISAIKSCGVKAGIALNPATALSEIKYLLDDIDMVLVMSVNPGYGGQKFIPIMLDKIAECRQIIGDRDILLQVDGGVGVDNASDLIAAGANVLVAGSAVFNAEKPGDIISAMRCK